MCAVRCLPALAWYSVLFLNTPQRLSLPSAVGAFSTRRVHKPASLTRYSGSKLHRLQDHNAIVTRRVGEVLSKLPRTATNVPVFLVPCQRHQDGRDEAFISRKSRVVYTLVWLYSTLPILPKYTNLQRGCTDVAGGGSSEGRPRQ